MTDHDKEMAITQKLMITAIHLCPSDSRHGNVTCPECLPIYQALRSVRKEENEKHEALIGVLVKAIEAAHRLQFGWRYLEWHSAGGPNECKHGYAENILCPRCDAMKIKDALSHPLVQEYLKKEKKP